MTRTSGVTLEAFLHHEDTEPASEYALGETWQKPMPNRQHAAIQFFLATVLGPFLQQNRLGRAFTELRCIFGPLGRERAYVPDLVYVSHERLSAELYLRTAPDLAIEIVSPDQHMGHLLDKMQFYLRYRVRVV
jgi:Uma2 family endonuclease